MRMTRESRDCSILTEILSGFASSNVVHHHLTSADLSLSTSSGHLYSLLHQYFNIQQIALFIQTTIKNKPKKQTNSTQHNQTEQAEEEGEEEELHGKKTTSESQSAVKDANHVNTSDSSQQHRHEQRRLRLLIALQLSDVYLPLANAIIKLLREQLSSINAASKARLQIKQEYYVLADTSYSPCCLDLLTFSRSFRPHQPANAATSATSQEEEQTCAFLLHFGTACFSNTRISTASNNGLRSDAQNSQPEVNVFYVFGCEPYPVSNITQSLLDCNQVQNAMQSLNSIPRLRVLLFFDLPWQYLIEPVMKQLEESQRDEQRWEFHAAKAFADVAAVSRFRDRSYSSVVGHYFKRIANAQEATTVNLSEQGTRRPSSLFDGFNCIIVIGISSSPLLHHLALITHHMRDRVPLLLFDTRVPSSSPSSSLILASSCSDVSKLLARRFYVAQKAQSAKVVGLLISTSSTSLAATIPLLKSVRAMLRASGRRTYVMSVGQINEAKLANFLEIDLWCLFACPFASSSAPNLAAIDPLILSRHWYRDIITVWELMRVLLEQEWDGHYETDATKLLQSEAMKLLYPSVLRDHELLNSNANYHKEEQNQLNSRQGQEQVQTVIAKSEDNEEEDANSELFFDSVTSKLRPRLQQQTFQGLSEHHSNAIIKAMPSNLSVANEFMLHHRHFTGLETREQRRTRLVLESDRKTNDASLEFSQIQAGLSGIASQYTKDIHLTPQL